MKITARIKRTNSATALAGQIRQRASQVVRKTTFDVEADAKQRAPVDTGALRNSIQGEAVGDLEGIVGVGAEYGVYVEYGTRSQPAQPYLVPAMDAARPGFERAVQEILK